jgi:sporulation protein YlmC with PRC-barrel domain
MASYNIDQVIGKKEG